MFAVHGENGIKWGWEVIFLANPDRADILGDMDLDFENFHLKIFWVPNFQVSRFPEIWLGQAWACAWPGRAWAAGTRRSLMCITVSVCLFFSVLFGFVWSMEKMAWDGPKWVLFPANPDLADILGNMDFGFENFEVHSIWGGCCTFLGQFLSRSKSR